MVGDRNKRLKICKYFYFYFQKRQLKSWQILNYFLSPTSLSLPKNELRIVNYNV